VLSGKKVLRETLSRHKKRGSHNRLPQSNNDVYLFRK